MTQLEALRAHSFLEGLSEAHLERLDACCASAVEFDEGEQIFREGEQAKACYLLQSGAVALEIGNREAGRRTLDRLGAGDVLGWSWLFPPFRWRFDARAESRVTAIALRAEPLRQVKDADHDLGIALMERFTGVILDRLHVARLGLAKD